MVEHSPKILATEEMQPPPQVQPSEQTDGQVGKQKGMHSKSEQECQQTV